MFDIKAIGLLAAILACPALALAQNATKAEQTASRLKEADRLEKQGMTSVGAGNYASAVVPLEAVLMIREKELGPDHADTVRVLNNLGLASLSLGRSAEAETLIRRALAANEKALGPDHPDVADILYNLAMVYGYSGDDIRRVEQSFPLLERAATIRVKALGPDHPRVAEIYNRMVVLDLFLAKRAGAWQMPDLLAGVRPTPASLARPNLSREEYLARAERECRQALAILEKAFGPDQLVVTAGLVGLAAVYTERGHYAQAEPLLKRALALFEKTRGPNHPETAHILDKYADALTNARKDSASLAEAKAMKTRARAILDGQVRRASGDAPPRDSGRRRGRPEFTRSRERPGGRGRAQRCPGIGGRHSRGTAALCPGHPGLDRGVEVFDSRARHDPGHPAAHRTNPDPDRSGPIGRNVRDVAANNTAGRPLATPGAHDSLCGPGGDDNGGRHDGVTGSAGA